MTGKVFSESTDVYQDQAQVLFDYYRKAAEQIVSEEQKIEVQIESLNEQKTDADARAAKAHNMFLAWIVAGAIALVVSFALVVSTRTYVVLLLIIPCAALAYKQHGAIKQAEAEAAQCSQSITEQEAAKHGIRRDYRVKKIGIAYIPVAQRIPSGGKSFVVDYTGEQPDTEFSLTLLNQPAELGEAIEGLREHLEELPAVESNEETEEVDTSDYSTSIQDVTLHDYTGTIDRQVRNIHYLIGDKRDVSVSVPAIPPSSDRYKFLEEYATSDTSRYPIVPVFDTTSLQQKVKEFSDLGELNQQATEDGSGNVTFFTDVMRRLAQSVDLLSRSRTASVSKLNNYTSGIFCNVLKASFDQYSPTLEAEEIERIRTATFDFSDEAGNYKPFALKESSRVRYDIPAGTWVADNGTRTAMPFGMHQVDAEVLMPLITNLMQENRKERMRVYNDIQDQKNDYLNQWHRETNDFFGRNRAEANSLIQRMNETYAQYVESETNYRTQSETFKAMKASGSLKDSEVSEAKNQAEVIAGFQTQANQARSAQEAFTDFMDKIRSDIDKSAEQFSRIEYYEASLRDSQARDIARAAASVRDLEPRRRGLAQVSAYLAENGSVPPEPTVSEKLDEDFAINLSSLAENEISALYDGQATGESISRREEDE